MEKEQSTLDGVILIKPQIHRDQRGFFVETYRKSLYQELGVVVEFVQDNHSFSRYGTLRGLHYQSDPGQGKLIRVAMGRIFDVAVDIRPNSPTFKQWQGFFLDSQDHHQLYIPKGFAHGFCVVSEEAHVMYKCSADYNAETECGFRWDDPDVGVEWPLKNPIISQRDEQAPLLRDLFSQN